MTLFLTRPFYQIIFYCVLVIAGSVPEGGACTTDDDHIDPSSQRFLSDCDEKTFCSSQTNGTCKPKLCRRDEFPFGFQIGDVLPPLCPRGFFCPDQGSGCQELTLVGRPCQLNRDDQCAPSPEFASFSSNQNFNGSLCLQSTCTYANATLGQRCFIDRTSYTDYGSDNQEYSFTVTRHNCRTPHLYCHPSILQCLPVKAYGLACSSDQECESMNCESNKFCGYPPEMPLRVETWQYVVSISAVVLAMVVIASVLVVIHKRIRLQRYRYIQEYYEEQLSLRQSLFALHAAAERIAHEKLYFDM